MSSEGVTLAPMTANTIATSCADVALAARYRELEEPEPEESAGAGLPRQGFRFRCFLSAFLQPLSEERRRLNDSRWNELPQDLCLPNQTMGRSHHSCGATYGVLERCNFACTSCYLSKNANATAALPVSQVHRQLDELRAFLGPKGKAQLTAGEVTLLPRHVLGGYVRYAKSIGLDPMVMSHGERLLAEPEYLERLVREDGLEKISIHVDSTQRGRQGWSSDLREKDLHSLRSRYAEMLRSVRRKTGRRLDAAHTVTVIPETLHEVPSVVRWLLDNVDAFRLVSFQPVAEVGRTQDRTADCMSLDSVWTKVCEGLGERLNRNSILFGHPECNIVAPLLVIEMGSKRILVEACRAGHRWDHALFQRLCRRLGPFSTIGGSPLLNATTLVSLALRNVPLLLEAPFYITYRLWGLRHRLCGMLRELGHLTTLRIRPFAVIIHKFMSLDELDTPLGRERLAACVFQVPVNNRMVPMCEMNATDLRKNLTTEQGLRSSAGSARIRSTTSSSVP